MAYNKKIKRGINLISNLLETTTKKVDKLIPKGTSKKSNDNNNLYVAEAQGALINIPSNPAYDTDKKNAKKEFELRTIRKDNLDTYNLFKKVQSGQASNLEIAEFGARARNFTSGISDEAVDIGFDALQKGYNELVVGKEYNPQRAYARIEVAKLLKKDMQKRKEFAALFDEGNYDLYSDIYDIVDNSLKTIENSQKRMEEAGSKENYDMMRNYSEFSSYEDVRNKIVELENRKYEYENSAMNGVAVSENEISQIDKTIDYIYNNAFKDNIFSSMSAEDIKDFEKRLKLLNNKKQQMADEYDRISAPPQDIFDDSYDYDKINAKKAQLKTQHNDLEKLTTNLEYNLEKHKKIVEVYDKWKKSVSDNDDSSVKYEKGQSGNKIYDAINYGVKYKDYDNGNLPNALQSDEYDKYDVWNFMNPEDKELYNKIWNKYGESKANQFVQDIRPLLNQREVEYDSAIQYKFDTEHPSYAKWRRRLTSTGLTIHNLGVNARNIYDYIAGNEIDPYSERFNPIRTKYIGDQAIKDQIDSQVGKIAYSISSEVIDLVLNMAISGGIGKAAGLFTNSANAAQIASKVSNISNQVLLSSNSMLDTTLKYKENGASDTAALGMGLISGIVEAWTERKSMSNLLKSPSLYKELTKKEFVKAFAKKLGVDFAKEGWEEVESNLLNTLAAFIFGQRNNDSFLSAHGKAILDGKSESDALIEAIKTVFPEYFESFVVGGFAGIAFGGYNAISGRSTYTRARDAAEAYFGENGYSDESLFGLMTTQSDNPSDALVMSETVQKAARGEMTSEEAEKMADNPVLSGVFTAYKKGYAPRTNVETESAPAETAKEPEYKSELDRIIHQPTLSNKNIDDIINNESAREEFQSLTGVKLDGTKAEMREAVKQWKLIEDYKQRQKDNRGKKWVTVEESKARRGENPENSNVPKMSKENAQQIIRETDKQSALDSEGRQGAKVTSNAYDTTNPTSFISKLIKDGYSEESATKIIDGVYSFVYSRGRQGADLQETVRAIESEIFDGSTKYGNELTTFYMAGARDSANWMRGKTNARVVQNDVEKRLLKERKIDHKTIRAMNAIARKLGIDIIFSDDVDGDGEFNTKTGVLKINANAKNRFFVTSVHESIHALRTIDPESYNRITDMVYEVLNKNEEVFSKAWGKTLAIYKKEATDENGNLNKDYIDEELNAKVISELLTNEEFIKELAKEDIGLAKRILNWLIDLFDKIVVRYSERSNSSYEVYQAVKALKNEFNTIKTMYQTALESTESMQGETIESGLQEGVFNKGTEYDSEMDREYLELAKDPEKNKVRLREMLIEAAKNAMPDSKLITEDGIFKESYHGTRNFGFSIFDTTKSDDLATLFFADTPELASTYSGKEGVTKKENKVSIEKLSPAELVEELNRLKDVDDDLLGTSYRYMSGLTQKNLKHDVEYGMNLLKQDIYRIKTENKEGIVKARNMLIDALEKSDYQRISTPLYTLLHYSDVFRNHKYVDFYAELESNVRLLNKLSSMNSGPKIISRELDGYAYEIYEISEAREILKQKQKKGIYVTYLNLKNPLILDVKGRAWNNIRNWSDSLIPPISELELINENASFYILNKNNNLKIPGAIVPETNATRELSEVQLISLLRQEASNIWAIRTENVKNTRGVSKIAKDWGYDGVVFNNILDSGGHNSKYNNMVGTVYVAFDPNQVKSADLVTYDDRGNIIPLSERFNLNSKDIRWSKQSVAKNSGRIYNKNTDQYRVMWTIEEGVMNDSEVSQFYDLVGEVKRGMKFPKTFDGETIFEIENKIVYADTDYFYPSILKVVEFSDADIEHISYYREVIEDYEQQGIKSEEYIEIIEAMSGQGTVSSTDFVDSKAYRREKNGKGKGSGSGTSNSRSGKNVLKSKPDTTTEENITPGKRRTTAQLKQSAFELDERIRKKLEQQAEKYGTMKKGESPSRDVTIPKETDAGKVRTFQRTAIEADSVSDEAAREIAESIANEELTSVYSVVSNKKVYEESKRLLEVRGFDSMLNEWEALLESGRKIEKQDISNAMLLVTEAGKKGDTETEVRILTQLAAEATAAGQSVQAFSLLKRLGPNAQTYAMNRTIEKIKRDIDKKYGKQIEVPENLLTQYEEALKKEREAGDGNTAESDKYADQIMRYIGEQIPANWLDKWNAWRMLSMLGNAKTHIRNFGSNVLMWPVRFFKDMNAIVLERVFLDKSKRTKTLKGQFTRGDILNFAKEDAKKIESVLRGESKYGDLGGFGNMQDYRRIFKTDWLEAASKKNSELLEKEDWWGLKLHYARAFTNYVVSQNIDVNNMTDKQLATARKIAVKEAQKATFRDANVVATWLNSAHDKSKVLGFAVDAVMPFKKTPMNVLKRGVEYSPVGLIKSLSWGIYQVRSGKINANEFIDGIAAGVTGTGLMLIGMLLKSVGLLRGVGDDDENEGRLSKLVGKQNYALVIGGHSYTIEWLSPSAMPLFVGCEFMGLLNEENISLGEFVKSFSRVLEPAFEMSMLKSINDLLSVALYEDLSSAALTSLGLEIPLEYLGQSVPTALGQVAKTIDNTRRKTYIKKDGWMSLVPDFVQSFIQQQMKKIPFLTFAFEEYVNEKGQTEKNAEGNIFSRVLQNFISPGYYKKVKSTAVDEEISRLYKTVDGASGIIPKTAKKTIKVNGKDYHLSAEQHNTYQEEMGKTYYEKAKEIITSDYYKGLSDSEKVKLLEKTMEYAGDKGKHKAVPEYKFDNGWLKTAMETPGGYKYLIETNKSAKFSEKDLESDAFDNYESQRDSMFRDILSNSELPTEDDAFMDKYYANLYQFTEDVALEANSDGQFTIDTKWINEIKGLSAEQQAEYIYGKTLRSMYDTDAEANTAINNDPNISSAIKLKLLNDVTVIPKSPEKSYKEHNLTKYKISSDTWLDVYNEYNKIKEIKQPNGKTLSKKDQIIMYINSKKISDEQKSALYRALGYKDTGKNLKVPWSYRFDLTNPTDYADALGFKIAYTNTSNYNNNATRGQCVWYARGRAKEKLSVNIPPLGNANQMYASAKPEARLEVKKSNIKPNTLVTYKVGTSEAGQTAGHVIYIEDVVGDTVYYTEGGYGNSNGVVKKSTKDNIMKGLSGNNSTIGTYINGIIDVTKY